jgi:hypothetical protein
MRIGRCQLRPWLDQLDDDQLAGLLSGLGALLEIAKSDQSQINQTLASIQAVK